MGDTAFIPLQSESRDEIFSKPWRVTRISVVGSGALGMSGSRQEVFSKIQCNTTVVSTSDGEQAVYSSRVRTLVDAVYDWSRFNGIPRGYEWIQRELKATRVSVAELVACALRYGDMGTIRRMGALLEKQGVEKTLLRKRERALTPTSGPIPWIPSRAKRGFVDKRWGVVMNDGK